MPAGPLVCDVCQEPGDEFRHLYDVSLIAVAECLGFLAEDNYCESCYNMIESRQRTLLAQDTPDRLERTPTVDTMDISLPPTQGSSTSTRQSSRVRLSEMPLPISPPRSSTTTRSSSNVSSVALDDTVDRLVAKKPRVRKTLASAIASQSLSLENVSSQDLSRTRRSRDVVQHVSPVVIVRSQTHSQDDSSLEEGSSLQVPPMPKNRRMRPGPKQFATGTLELPLSVTSKVLTTDFPRVLAG